MSDNLSLSQVTASQNNKEVTINDQAGELDAALTDTVTYGVTSSNARTLTDAEFQRFHFLTIDEDGGDPADAAITLTVPAVKRGLFLLTNDTAFDVTVTISGQPVTAPVIAAGDVALLSCDGTNALQPAAGSGGAADFLSLTDTPSSFTGEALRGLRVNSGESALEFVALGAGGGLQPVAVTPTFRGALLSLDGTFNTSGTIESLPWGAADYDTTFQPATGGAQRLWLGINRTFIDGDVTTGTDVIGDTAHGFTTGEGPVRLTSSGTLPAGLAVDTDYWIITVDANSIALAVSRAGALSDVRVDITAAAGGGTHTVNTETKLVVPAGVTKVRLVAGVDTESTTSAETHQLIVLKNFGAFPGIALTSVGHSTSAGSKGLVVTTPVQEVAEGDVFEAQVDIGAGTFDIDDTAATFFAMEVVETTEVQPLPTAFLAVQPTHEGALLNLNANLSVANATDTSVPWGAADYDTTFQPNDTGGVQRFWLGPDITFIDGDVTVGTDVVAETAHGFVTGEGPVRLTSSGTLPAGLSLATDYWVIADSVNGLAFATNRANALADTRVDITAAAGGGTHTIETATWIVVPANVTKMRFGASSDWAAADDSRSFLLLKNEALVAGGLGQQVSFATGVNLDGFINGFSATLEVTEGDRFEIRANQDSGASINLEDTVNTWFSAEVADTDKPFSFPGVTVSPPHRGALVTHTTNTTNISGGVILDWDTESFDTDGFHDTVTNNSRFTIPAGVTKVKISAQIALTDLSVSSETFLSFRINGGNLSPVVQGTYKDDSTGGFSNRAYQIESYVIDVVEGDYLEIRVNNSSTSNDDIKATDTWFSLEVVEADDAATPPESVEHFAVGVPTVSITIFAKVAARRFSMFDDLLNSQAEAQTAPSGGAVAYDVQRNNVSIGTITFADGVATATFATSGSGDEVFEVGDVLEIITPADLQTMANVAFNLWAFRS